MLRFHAFQYLLISHHPSINTQILFPQSPDHIFCVLGWLLRTGEVVCCVELLDTKAISAQVTPELALLLVRLILC